MESSKNKQIKRVIYIFIILISFVELYFAYKVAIVYAGVYDIGIFTIFIFQLFWYFRLLFKEQKSHLKSRIIRVALVSIILPVAICFTLPSYTYREGKKLIEEQLQSTADVIFVEIPKEHDTVPICNNPKRFLVSDRAYYYEIESNGQKEYYLVNPIDGYVSKWSESYWEYVDGDS